jgi:hypothetical protein
MSRAHGEDAPKPPQVSLRRVDEAPLRGPPKRVGATMWPHRRADEAPLPRAAEGRRTRGAHQAAADKAPLSPAGAFFSTQNVPLVAGPKKCPLGGDKIFEPPFNFMWPSAGLPSAASCTAGQLARFTRGPYVFRFDTHAPPGPVVCNQARPARPC